MMVMTFLAGFEVTREFVFDLLVDATLGRVVEAVVVALAGYFWRSLVRVVTGWTRRIASQFRNVLRRFVTALTRSGHTLRVRPGLFFGTGRRTHANWTSLQLRLLPL